MRRTTRVFVLVFITLAAGTVGTAAASFGGATADSLLAQTSTTRAIIAFDQFTGANGTPLNGTLTDTPPLPYATPWTNYTWSDFGGTWRIQTNRARCNTSVAAGNLRFNTSTTEMSVVANVVRAATTYSGALMINHDGTNAFLARVRTNTGTTSWLELVQYNGTFTVISQVSIPIATTYVVRIESYGDTTNATMKVYLGGVLKINTTLSPAQAALAHGASAVGVGLMCNSDISTAFDFFHVDV